MIGAKHFISCKQKCLGVRCPAVGCGATDSVGIPPMIGCILFKPHMLSYENYTNTTKINFGSFWFWHLVTQ